MDESFVSTTPSIVENNSSKYNFHCIYHESTDCIVLMYLLSGKKKH